jgi:hypothetical protein
VAVIYQLKTLKVLRAEFAPGKAYEHDVPGLYAQVCSSPARCRASGAGNVSLVAGPSDKVGSRRRWEAKDE